MKYVVMTSVFMATVVMNNTVTPFKPQPKFVVTSTSKLLQLYDLTVDKNWLIRPEVHLYLEDVVLAVDDEVLAVDGEGQRWE